MEKNQLILIISQSGKHKQFQLGLVQKRKKPLHLSLDFLCSSLHRLYRYRGQPEIFYSNLVFLENVKTFNFIFELVWTEL